MLSIFRSKAKSTNATFNKGDKVQISNDENEFVIRQKKCGGYSAMLMKNILGNKGEIIHCSTNYAKVKVGQMTYDISYQLLKLYSQSMPQTNVFYSFSTIDTSFSTSRNICQTNGLSKSLTNDRNSFLLDLEDPPVDESLIPDVSDIKYTAYPAALPVAFPSDQMFSSEQCHFSHSPVDGSICVNLPSPPSDYSVHPQVQSPIYDTLSAEKKSFNVLSNTDSDINVPSISKSQFLCSRCKFALSQFKFDCRHLFCEKCSQLSGFCDICGITTTKRCKFFL